MLYRKTRLMRGVNAKVMALSLPSETGDLLKPGDKVQLKRATFTVSRIKQTAGAQHIAVLCDVELDDR